MATAHTLTWQLATVVATEQITPTARRVVLRPDRPTRIHPGAHVDVRLELGGEQTTRSYSIVEPVCTSGDYALTIHLSEVSRGGAIAMHALRPGDRIEVSDPLQDFPFRPGARRYVFLAGGVGITALIGMARTARRLGADYRFVYCGRDEAVMPYLDALRAEHGDALETHVKSLGTTLSVPDFLTGIRPGEEVYMCGPIRLMDAVRRGWEAAGLAPADLRFETFGNSGWHAPEPFTVRIPAQGASCVVRPSQTLLEALEEAGIDALSDCRKGECGLCEARVLRLEGEIDHRDVFYSERQRDAGGKLCPCVSRIRATGDGPAVVELQLT